MHLKRFNYKAAIPLRQYGSGTPLFLFSDATGDISHALELTKLISR